MVRRPISNEDRATLEFLQQELVRSYQLARAERARMHEAEWSGAEKDPILGEAEVRADFVAGIADSWLRRGLDGKHEETLAKSLLPVLERWLREHSAEYPCFAAYLQAIEHLRAVEYRLLRQLITPA